MNKDVFARHGDKGRKVKIAQKCLRKAGSKIKVNGLYTIGMVSAVANYQQKMGLAVDGRVIDKATWNSLKHELFFLKRIF